LPSASQHLSNTLPNDHQYLTITITLPEDKSTSHRQQQIKCTSQ